MIFPKVALKLIFGLLGFSAVVTEVIVLANNGVLVPANFFSYFTIQSNIIVATVFLVSGCLLLLKQTPSLLFEYLRGAAALYIIITGVIFSLLLAGLDITLTAAPWDNIVLHYIIPIVAVLDWLIDPPQRKLLLRYAYSWLVYPVVYLIYSLIRGNITGWYPYPFLNPETSGYGGIIIVAIGIMIFSVAGCYGLIRYSNKRLKPESTVQE